MLKVEIVIKGHIDPEWKGWFEDLDIVPDDANTSRLTGYLIDQSALYGVLSRLRDLGLELVSIKSAEHLQDNS
jgi:hypothetical protein